MSYEITNSYILIGVATSRPKAASAKGSMGGIVLPPPPGGASASGRLPTSVSGSSLAVNNDSSVMKPQQPAVDNLLLGDFAEPTPPAPPLSSMNNSSQNQSTSGFSDFDDWGDFAAPTKPPTVASSGNWEQF